jgi:hypothetical protein
MLQVTLVEIIDLNRKSFVGIVRPFSVRHIPYINTHHPVQSIPAYIQLANARNACNAQPTGEQMAWRSGLPHTV